MKLLSALIGFIIAVLALCFALSNRQMATLSLWPFDLEVQAPIYLLSLGTLFAGLIIGAIITTLAMIPHRLQARRLHKDIAKLNDKILDLQQTIISPTSSQDDLQQQRPFLTSKSLRRFWTPK